jgi:hypothetical protein
MRVKIHEDNYSLQTEEEFNRFMKFIDFQYDAPVRVEVNKDYKYIAHVEVVYFLVRAHNFTREELIEYFEDRREKGQ